MRRRTRTLAGVIVFVLLAARPVSAQIAARLDIGPFASDLQGPAVVRAAYVAALNAADPDALQRLYAPDALAAFGDGRLVRGGESISTRIRAALASVTDAARVTIQPLGFARDGDIATERGVYSVSFGTGDRERTSSGVYVVVYTRHADNRWRIAMEVRTTGDQPPLIEW